MTLAEFRLLAAAVPAEPPATIAAPTPPPKKRGPGRPRKVKTEIEELPTEPFPAIEPILRTRKKRVTGADYIDQWKHTSASGAAHNRAISLAGRDIGEIPEPLFVEEHAACRRDLHRFCLEFLPGWFPKPFCDQQVNLLDEMQQIILNGGMQAIALPRHRGKTTITRAACVWATLYGHRKYVVWLVAHEKMAKKEIDGFARTVRHNEKIVAAFPKACYPLAKQDGNQKSKPLYHGREMRMGIKDQLFLFPDIEGSDSESVNLEITGLGSAIRGQSHVRRDGTISRPDFVVLDDPQTDEVARSDSQCDTREKFINGAVLGLGGPGVKMSVVMPCTIIRHGDLSSRLLDRELNPDWHGVIGKMLETLPLRMDLWDKYNNLRIISLNEGHTIKQATKFYVENQEQMDRGALATWDHDLEEDEHTAIQHAMNLYYKDKESFFAEYQNCPLQAWDAAEQLDAKKLIERTSLLERGVVPDDTAALTAMVDIHKDVLYFVVVAWRRNFSGHVVSYGTWPDQELSYFAQREATVKIGKQKGLQYKSLDTQLQLALAEVFDYLDQDWRMESGESIRLKLALIDANWNLSTKAVDKFAATGNQRGRIYPSHGKGITGNQKPIAEWRKVKGDARGDDWIIPVDRNERLCRHVVFDTNIWKSRVAEMLLAVPDGPASLTFHKPGGRFDHRLLVDHLCSEKREPKPGANRMIDVWKLPDHRPDNHWFDGFIGAAVAASICGIQIPLNRAARDVSSPKKIQKERVHYGEW